MKKSARGVTLIELMVVIAVLAVIASIAVPSYRGYVRRAQRADATAALLQLRQMQEKFFLQNSQYATGAQLTTAPPGGLGLKTTSEHGHYDIVLNRPTPTTFTATATASATGGQTSDGPCQTFTINEAGVRGSGPGAITTCWK
ncbi:MAG TPA: type IV pilin protein [Steroidobacteraceae bacterium]|nr:type IV pilin protein [Steroidobacteraceae bacterium]